MTLRLGIGWYFSLLFFLVSPRAADFYRVEWSDDEPRHLVPRRGESIKHDRDIENTLSVTDTIARFIEVSAFGPERSLTVYVDVTKTAQEKYDGWGNVPEEERRYAMTVKVGNAFPNQQTEITRTDRTISRELAVAVQRAWAKALHLTCYPSHRYEGLDGATFIFVAEGMEGEIWTPTKGIPRELVDMSLLLIQFTEQKAPNEVSEEVLIRTLRRLEARIPEVRKS